MAACLLLVTAGCNSNVSNDDSNKKVQIEGTEYSDLKNTEYVQCAQDG